MREIIVKKSNNSWKWNWENFRTKCI